MDLDLVLVENNGAARILQNQLEVEAPGYYSLSLRPQQDEDRGDAIGARIEILQHNGTQQIQEVVSGGSYLSQGPLSVHFGLGRSTSIKHAQIYWVSLMDWDGDGIADRPPPATVHQGIRAPRRHIVGAGN
jgi:hypothetical protein